jgi:hypothetical protein
MAKYMVKSPIQMGGRRYEPGETIELTGEQAAEMPWAVEAAAAPAEKPAEQSPAPGVYVAVKDFQFRGDKYAAGEALELTAEEAEKLGPERVAPAPNEPPEAGET